MNYKDLEKCQGAGVGGTTPMLFHVCSFLTCFTFWCALSPDVQVGRVGYVPAYGGNATVLMRRVRNPACTTASAQMETSLYNWLTKSNSGAI